MRTELFQVRLGSGERLVAKDVGQAHGLPTSSRYSLLLSDVNRVAQRPVWSPDRRAFHKLTCKRVHNGRGRLCSLAGLLRGSWQVWLGCGTQRRHRGTAKRREGSGLPRTDGPVVLRAALGLKTLREKFNKNMCLRSAILAFTRRPQGVQTSNTTHAALDGNSK